jgi:integrase
MRLTDISIKSLKPPPKGAVIYADDILPGFGVRVSQAGAKSFVLTHGRTRTRETIGRVGIVGLSDARQDAKRRLAEYTLGKSLIRSVAWNIAVKEYLSEVQRDNRPRTYLDYDRLLNKHFRFGETKLSALQPTDISAKLNRLSDRPAEKRHAFVILRVFINWAYRKHYLDQSPLARMQPPKGYNARSRILTDEELMKVWRACEGTFGDIVKILILTGQRVGEISRLTSDVVREGTITLPSWGTKNGHEHTFPIGALSKEIVHGKTGLVFPARGRETTFNGFSKCKAKLDRTSGVKDWTLHDLRRTFASGLASIGVQLPVVERLLNHVSGSFSGIVGVYQRYDFFPEMQDAITRWEEHVRKLLEG